jgi:hypothetical protein
VAILATRGPDHHDHAPGQKADAADTLLAIVAPVVERVEMGSGKQLLRIPKIQAALGQTLVMFGGIESDRS